MIALWIGIFLFLQAMTLLFFIALGKSSASADRQFELAFAREHLNWSQAPITIDCERLTSNEEPILSRDTIQ